MRILHVLDHSLPEASGYSLRSHNIILEQRKLGWSTFQVTGPKQNSPADTRETANGLEFFRTASWTPGWLKRAPFDFFWTVYRFRRRVRAVIREVQPDLVHAHSPCTNGLAALGCGLPVVYEMRTLWEDGSILAGRLTEGSLAHRFARALETFVLRRADAVTTISEGLRAEVVGRGVPEERVSVIGNAVDAVGLARTCTSADRQASRRRFGVRGDYVLGYIGSLFAWEGLEVLLRALAQIRAQRNEFGLLVVGSGPEESELRKVASKLGVAEHVVFTGRIPHEAALQAYDAIDLLVYPRLPMRLTELVTPLKPLEAMALGKPLIASDVGGHRELVRHRDTGVLFAAGDDAALAAAIVEVADDEKLRNLMIQNGLEFVREERSWSGMVRGYEPVYDALLGRGRVGTADQGTEA